MNQKTKFTRGPVRTRAAETYNAIEIESREGNICKVYGTALSDNPMHPMNQLRNTNTELIVAAFNSATAAQDMGFDGIKAVEALPKLLEALKKSQHAVGLALCGTPSAHYFNELKERLGAAKDSYTLEDNLKLNMADIKGACSKADSAIRAALAQAGQEEKVMP